MFSESSDSDVDDDNSTEHVFSEPSKTVEIENLPLEKEPDTLPSLLEATVIDPIATDLIKKDQDPLDLLSIDIKQEVKDVLEISLCIKPEPDDVDNISVQASPGFDNYSNPASPVRKHIIPNPESPAVENVIANPIVKVKRSNLVISKVHSLSDTVKLNSNLPVVKKTIPQSVKSVDKDSYTHMTSESQSKTKIIKTKMLKISLFVDF